MWKSACVDIHQLLKRNNVLVQVCKRTREICALCNTRSLRYLTNITDHFLLAYFLYKRTPLSLLCGTNAVWSNKQHLSYQIRSIYNVKKSKGVPWQAEVAQGVLGRLRSRIFLTFWHYKGGRSSAKHTDCLYRTHFQRLSRPQGRRFCRGYHGKNPQWHHRESIPGPSD